MYVSYLQIYCEVVSDLLIGPEYCDSDRNGGSIPGTGPGTGSGLGPGLGSGTGLGTGSGLGAGSGLGLGLGINQLVSISATNTTNTPIVPYNTNHLSIREKNGSVFVEGLSRSRVCTLSDLTALLLKVNSFIIYFPLLAV